MPRPNSSSRKAAALRPRTLAKLHRAVAAARPLLETLETRTLLATLAINPFSMTGTLSEADITTRYDFALIRSDTESFQTVGFAFAPLGANPADSADLTLLGDGVDDQFHTVTFAPGETYASLHVAPIDDDLLEFDEQAQLQFFDIQSPDQVLASADLLVQSDDCRVWVSGGGTMNENSGTVDFIVHREDAYGLCPNAYAVAIRVKTAGHGDIRASADDYTVVLDNMDPGPGPDPNPLDLHNYYWVPFQANQSQAVVTVAAVNDSLPEPTEWLKLVLIGGAGFNEPSPPLSQTLPTQAYAGIEDDDNYIAPPSAPTNLSANPFSDTAITLAWQDNSSDETGFLLEQSTDRVNWSTVQVFDPDSTTATLDNLDPATDYAFRLRAENPNASVPSDFTPPLPASTQWQNLGAPLAVPITTTGENPVWLNNGETLVAGEGYRLVYGSGGVNYSSQSPPNTWTAASYAVRSEDWNYTHWQNEPNGFPFVSTLDQVPSIAGDLTWSFTSPGAKMGLYFNAGDPQYYSGPGVTWQLQKQIPHVSLNLNNGNHTTEGDTTPLQITLTRDAYFNEPLTVHYTITPNTADASDILDPFSGTATIDANSFSVDIPILATDDTTPEWTERLDLTIASGPGYFCAGLPPEIQVADNDLALELDIPQDCDGEQILLVNNDDDDNDWISDLNDEDGVQGDDDLAPLSIIIPPETNPGAVVSLIVNAPSVVLWSSQDKLPSSKLLDPCPDTITWISGVDVIPNVVYVEAVAASIELRDITFTLSLNETTAHNPPPSPQPRDVSISATTIRMYLVAQDEDVTGTRSESIRVGKRVHLRVENDALPEGLSLDSVQWDIPSIARGDVIKQYTQTVSVGQVTPVAASDLSATTLEVYYIFADNHDVSCNLTINGRAYERTGTLAITAPLYEVIIDSTTADQPPITISAVPPYNYVPVIHFGSVASPGIRLMTAMPNEPTGEMAWTQLIHRTAERMNFNSGTIDRREFTAEPLSASNYLLDDAAGIQLGGPRPVGTGISSNTDMPQEVQSNLFTFLEVSDRFKSYFMYKPTGADSIWVPVARVEWGWSARAVRDDSHATMQIVESNVQTPVIRYSDAHLEMPEWVGYFTGLDWVQTD